ncbi:MAG: glycosyltransferase [Victivallaceae bacterium]|nr:glycosyltransferase [Victivallaceae bacterium]
MTPLISIIVPIYNCEKYIRQCIASVVSQSFADWELILVDDGSTDDSRSICEEYAEKNPQIKIFTQSNQGPGAARNTGLIKACGEYLIFLDSDDYLNTNCLSGIKDTIYGKPGSDIILGRVLLVSETGSYIRDYNESYDIDRIEDENSIDVMNYLFSRRNSSFWSVWNHVFEMSFLKETGVLFKDDIYAEDLDWTLQIFFKAESFTVLNTPFICHRERKGESLSFSIKMELDLYSVVFKWIDKLKDMEMEIIYYMTITDAIINIYYCNLWHMWNHPGEERLRILKLLNEHKYIWNMGISRKCRLLGFLCRTIGPSATSFLLNIRQRIKNVLQAS